MTATRLISMHVGKGKTLAQCQRDRTDFAQNPERLHEIAVLRTHVINFAKASDTFRQYKASGYNREFFEAHRQNRICVGWGLFPALHRIFFGAAYFP